MSKKKVLLVGWDAADWKIVNQLVDEGKMPGTKHLIENGVMGNLSTLHPILSPMLWTSIATGKRPHKHGIYGFSEPTPDGQGVQPITILSRKTKAVWNILNQQEKRSIVVGWWPSHPAEPINGAMVSDFYQKGITHPDQPWPIRQNTVHPAELQKELADLRFHPSEFTKEEVLTFLPQGHKINQDRDMRLHQCVKIMAECTSIQSAATHLMETQEWDFAAIYFDAIDHFCHLFMKYYPPKRDFVPKQDYEIYKDVIDSGYIYHDMMLCNLMKLAGEDTTVILMSDHGFHSDHLRPETLPQEPAGPAAEHRDFGIFAMSGPGIKKDHLIHGAGLLDIAPTILHLYGLPVGEDMDGQVLLDAFEEPEEVTSIPSWDKVEGDAGTHPPERTLDPFEAEESLQQLVDLGYIEAPTEDQSENVRRTTNELNYNLARAFIDAGREIDAVHMLASLFKENPSEYRYGIRLAFTLKRLGRVSELDQLLKILNDRRFEDAEAAKEGLTHFRELGQIRLAERRKKKEDAKQIEESEESDNGGDEALPVPDAEKFFEQEKIKDDQRPEPLFSEAEWKQIYQLRGVATINQYAIEFLTGYVHFAQGRVEEAITYFQNAIDAEPNRPGLHIQIGEALLQSGDIDRAEQAFGRAHEIDEFNPTVMVGLAHCCMKRNEHRSAIKWLLSAVSQLFDYPMAHFYLGLQFRKLGKIDKAIEALKVSVSQNPNNEAALEMLGEIYEHQVGDIRDAGIYYELAKQAREVTEEQHESALAIELPTAEELAKAGTFRDKFKSPTENLKLENRLPSLRHVTEGQLSDRDNDSPFVTIVTGLPRSGTSMMMQMLAAGGLEAFSDGNRKADEDNPNGYLEHNLVKQLAANNSWVRDGIGKSIKVIIQLLEYLPVQLNYRVIFMERNIDEVVSSQRIMLERNDKSGAKIDDQKLRDVFERQLKSAVELLNSANVEFLCVDYADTIENPSQAAKSVASFLGIDLNVDHMIESVDSSLYRNRSAQPAK